MRKPIVIALLLGLAFSVIAAPAAFADDNTGGLILHKFFRGIVNAATGWMELFKQPTLETQEKGPKTGLTWGIVKGIGYAVGRSVVGAYEIVTFPLPIPEGYRPIMDPEFVLSDVEGGVK